MRFLSQVRAHATMLQFSLGERVCFQPDDRPLVYGIITRYNRKTVTVITESAGQWRVPPSVLRKAPAPKTEHVLAEYDKLITAQDG
jgi:hypothetical protein